MAAAVVRPLAPADVAAADLVASTALEWAVPAQFMLDEAVRAARSQARIAHLQQTDPDGAFVACDADSGEIIGIALAIVREGLWGLSLLGVAPDRQGTGVGGELLRAALRTRPDEGAAIILSSTNPAAMRSYTRAGLDLLPCVCLAGVLDRAGLPAGLGSQRGDPQTDSETIDRAARHVRGASYERDVAVLVEHQGGELLVFEDRGFAVHRDGSPALLCALDEDVATDLLLSCLAAASPGASVHVDFVMAGHDWAIAAGLACGLSLSPEGPVFARGVRGTMAPFLPSGAYL